MAVIIPVFRLGVDDKQAEHGEYLLDKMLRDLCSYEETPQSYLGSMQDVFAAVLPEGELNQFVQQTTKSRPVQHRILSLYADGADKASLH